MALGKQIRLRRAPLRAPGAPGPLHIAPPAPSEVFEPRLPTGPVFAAHMLPGITAEPGLTFDPELGAAADKAARWTEAFTRKRGWRMADGGKSVPLANNRTLWLFGDSWASGPGFEEGVFITGSTVAVSGREPPPAAPINFYSRWPMMASDHSPDPTNNQPIYLTDGIGLQTPLDPPDSRLGAWEWTGHEKDRDLSQRGSGGRAGSISTERCSSSTKHW